MLHCNGIDPFVTLMGNFNWGPIPRNDIVSTLVCTGMTGKENRTESNVGCHTGAHGVLEINSSVIVSLLALS